MRFLALDASPASAESLIKFPSENKLETHPCVPLKGMQMKESVA